MARLCERPGCSEPGAVAYGMVPEDLLFWMAPLQDVAGDDHNVLCRRHADAMSVPRGWTLDDRREPVPRLFQPRRTDPATSPSTTTARPARRRRKPDVGDVGEQLQIDGTGEIARPEVEPDPEPSAGWQPEFDHDDDLGGLLEVRSPLLARAFRGTGRPKG